MTPSLMREKIGELLERWEKEGSPSTSGYISIGHELLDWKRRTSIEGLWQPPPVMVTATLDDGWGNGLKPIHLYAGLAGIDVIEFGLLRSVREIVAACEKHRPNLLGLTILQFDSLEDLDEIVASVPAITNVVVGGPVFKRAGNAGWRGRGYYAARDVASFLRFLLDEIN